MPRRWSARAHRSARYGPRTPRAFTLIEILIVVLILAILATVATKSFGSAGQDAQAAAVQSDLRHIQTRVMLEASTGRGLYPADITPDTLDEWFGKPVRSAYALPTTPLGVEIDSSGDSDVVHPADKVLSGALPAWWYNPANGVVRARVPDQGSATATRDLYVEVNITSIGDLSDVYADP